MVRFFWKKTIDIFLPLWKTLGMFKSTDKYKIVKSDKLQDHLDMELKNILDMWLDPEYVRAIQKLEEICSKQNYLYN